MSGVTKASSGAMSADDAMLPLTDEQETCLDRLLREAGKQRPRANKRFPMPLTMRTSLKKQNQDNAEKNTISQMLWDDEFGKQVAQAASSSSRPDQQQASTKNDECSKGTEPKSTTTTPKSTITRPKGPSTTPKGTKSTPKGIKSQRWIPDPNNQRELELRRIKDSKIHREMIRKQKKGVYTTPRK